MWRVTERLPAVVLTDIEILTTPHNRRIRQDLDSRIMVAGAERSETTRWRETRGELAGQELIRIPM